MRQTAHPFPNGTDPKSAALTKLLVGAGYRVAPHPLEPSTVLVSGSGEQYVVRGATEEGWVEALLAEMAPSRLARATVSDALERVLAEGAHPEAAPPRLPPGGAPSPSKSERYLAEVGRIASDIDARYSELAQSAPRIVVAQIVVWVAEARAAQEGSGGDRSVTDAVHLVVRRLAQMARDLWPGSVRILRRDSTPLDVGEGIGTWGEAAVSARTELTRLGEELRSRGFDAYGFADHAWLKPPPVNPWELLQEAEEAQRHPLDGSGAELLVEAAAKLRWARGRVAPLRWGAAMGKLRRAAFELGDTGEALRTYLHPSFSPGEPWRDLFDVEPADEPTNRANAAATTSELAELLLEEPPAADLDEVGVIAWLARASTLLDAATMAWFLAPARRTLAAVDIAVIGEPSVAGCLRNVRELLEAGEPRAKAPPGLPALVGPEVSPDLPFLLDLLKVMARGRRALLISDVDATPLVSPVLEGLAFEVVQREPAAFEAPEKGDYSLVVSALSPESVGTASGIAKAARAAGLEHIAASGLPAVALVVAVARVLLDQRSG